MQSITYGRYRMIAAKTFIIIMNRSPHRNLKPARQIALRTLILRFMEDFIGFVDFGWGFENFRWCRFYFVTFLT